MCLQHPLDARINLRQRRRQRGGILAARLGHIRPAAAFAAHRLRDRSRQLARVNLRGQILGDAGDDRNRRILARGQHHHCGLPLIAQRIDQRAKLRAIEALDLRRQNLRRL